MFSFYPCDLSFNGTTPARGQIPCILYYSSPIKAEAYNSKIHTEIHARDTALRVSCLTLSIYFYEFDILNSLLGRH